MNKIRKKVKSKRMEVMTYKKCLSIKRDDGLRMRCVDKFTMPAALRCTVSRNFKRPFMSTYKSDDVLTYGKFNFLVQNQSAYFAKHGIVKGDKISIVGESCPNWMISYFAITSLGAIAVPVLPNFSTKEMNRILTHSEAKGAIIIAKHYEKILPFINVSSELIIRMDDLFHIPSSIVCDINKANNFAEAAGFDVTKYRRKISDDKLLAEFEKNVFEDDVASLIYTSGTTGTSKGVLLTHKNLVWNADICSDRYIHIKPNYKFLSILPTSHVYEFTTGQQLVMMNGAQIIFLGKPPAPSILLPALLEVRPQILLTVPLLIEKVYRTAIAPTLRNNKTIVSLLKNPLTKGFVSKLIGRKLKVEFGGRVKFFGIGGAPLDSEVENFLYDIRFPYALGYGLTETSPMIAGCSYRHSDHVKGTLGKLVPNTIVRVENPDIITGVGELLVKSPSVMKGYFKNDELTAEVMTDDGFFRTGDLGFINKKRLSLKGRSKTMILGSGGENIYPESIESLINNKEFVQESLVVPDGSGLIALIKIDIESYAKISKLSMEDAKDGANEYIKKLKRDINKELNAFSKIYDVTLQEEPFQRTPTQKIKRFIYSKAGKGKNKDEKNKKINK